MILCMSRRHVRRKPEPLAIALCASLSLHALVLAPSLMVAVGLVDGPASMSNPPPPETLIGIEESNATTIDWIGYAEYEEHRAPLSETNQAAFAEAPSISSPDSEAIAMETTASELPAAPVPVEAVPESTPTEAPDPESTETIAADKPVEAAASETPLIEIDQLLEVARALALSAFAPRRPTAPAAERPQTLPATPSHAAATPSAPSDPSVGERSDKDSDPSSTIEVTKEQWALGKPLAARGGELHPRRMEITPLTRMTAWVKDAVVSLVFDHRGVVVNVELLQSSGHSQVDKNMIDSLYGWRAVGGRFAELRQGETIAIELRYILSR
jgi:hypothetical protein